MIFPIKPHMSSIDIKWMRIGFDEKIRKMKARGKTLLQMTEYAAKKMQKITEPGRLERLSRQKKDPHFHPRHLKVPNTPVPAQLARLYSSCGVMHSTVCLFLANAGVKNLSLLDCRLGILGEKPSGHVMGLLAPDSRKEFPNGAILHFDYFGQPHWFPIAPRDFRKYNDNKRRPVFQSQEILYEIKK